MCARYPCPRTYQALHFYRARHQSAQSYGPGTTVSIALLLPSSNPTPLPPYPHTVQVFDHSLPPSPPLLLHHGWPYRFGQSHQDRNCRTYLTFTPPPLLFYVHLQIKHNGVFGCKGSVGHASVQKVSGMVILAGSARLRWIAQPFGLQRPI